MVDVSLIHHGLAIQLWSCRGSDIHEEQVQFAAMEQLTVNRGGVFSNFLLFSDMLQVIKTEGLLKALSCIRSLLSADRKVMEDILRKPFQMIPVHMCLNEQMH